MKTFIGIVFFLFLLPFTANAATEKQYIDFFKKYESLGQAYDTSVSELYSDKAVLRALRKMPDGKNRILQMDGSKWKSAIKDTMEIAKQRGDQSEFSNISVSVDGNKAKISASKYSTIKCFTDNKYYMQVEEQSDGTLQIIEESMESPMESSCKNTANNDLDLVLQGAAKMINKQLPLMVDSDSKLVKATAEGKTLTYHYTLIKYSADDLDPEALKETLKPMVTQQTCTMPNLRPVVDKGATIRYQYNGNDEKKNRDSIPTILSDALGVSFDTNVGHDYLVDYEARYESYHRKEDKIPFDLEYFDKITKGGLPNKTLNIALAGTGVGKSLFMCHVASSALLQGKNVLYITLEMAEEKIAERIDANLLNVNIQDITDLPKQMFDSKVTNLAEKTQGTLIIKEYPTASAHSGHFKALLQELALKKSFRPDIIFIDYLNICASSRYKAGSNVNSYSFIKAIAEELRGLAVEANLPIVSATQTTRSGFASSDVDLTDTSESFGLPATADLMFALISTEELEGLNQIMVKQLKNRYNDPTMNKRFVVGIDRAKMRLYDCEQKAQEELVDSGQEEEYTHEEKPKKSFGDFKF